jgi:hypothetical protein
MSAVGISATEAQFLINTRAREVWTTDERRLLDRLAKIFNMHGDRLLFECGSECCPNPHIVIALDDSAPGGAVLRCGCTDRQFVRAI